ncbi:hypothetical protein L1I79_35520 [Strepomyces sp. STD 3.1]|nr:hypothetical protein [Streptomyces sp. STD 3.1]
MTAVRDQTGRLRKSAVVAFSVREAAVTGRYCGVRGVESQNQAMAFAVRKGPSAKTR